MNDIYPYTQRKLFGLERYFLEFVRLFKENNFPTKILLSGEKGIGKSTLAYHFINFVLSLDEKCKYDIKNFAINAESSAYKTIINKSNLNFIKIDILPDKKFIDINQIRNLINSLNKSSLNEKPRFVLIDNIEQLNKSSINALLKILEEPNKNINFILINNNKKILKTLLSRCINFKIHLSHKECLDISNQILNTELDNLVHPDLINYYFTPGNIYKLVKFSEINNYKLSDYDLKDFLIIMIKDNQFKKDSFIRYIIFDFVEFYLRKLNNSFSSRINNKYNYFLKKISDTKTFNLDEESLFTEIKENVLNG